jgi:hypothetical protein
MKILGIIIISDKIKPMSAFNIHRLPLEVRLEIFGCLAHTKWTRLAAHKRRTGKVLVGNRRYLEPLPRLYRLELVCFKVLLPKKLF